MVLIWSQLRGFFDIFISDEHVYTCTYGLFFPDEDEKIQGEIDSLLSASEPYITEGINYFKKINDRNNSALLISNSARLLRIKAQVMVRKDRVEFTAEERTLYNQVTMSCNAHHLK